MLDGREKDLGKVVVTLIMSPTSLVQDLFKAVRMSKLIETSQLNICPPWGSYGMDDLLGSLWSLVQGFGLLSIIFTGTIIN